MQTFLGQNTCSVSCVYGIDNVQFKNQIPPKVDMANILEVEHTIRRCQVCMHKVCMYN
jgi:hypothetical protein